MSFPRVNAPKRTDYSFRNRLDPDHHKTDSILEQLPVNLIEDFPIADSLHLFDIGIMKKCLIGWSQGSFNFRTKFSAKDIEDISKFLEESNFTKPRELHRRIRGLDSVRFWKALEFRSFLLYLGPVVLKDYLSNDAYYHFLILFCAVTFCSCSFYSNHLNLANQLFLDYIEMFIDIYGLDSVSSNIHNLCHVVDDVEKFGNLVNISSYPFENTLYKIKNLLRHGNRPLAQVAKRISEWQAANDHERSEKYPVCSMKNSEHESYKKIQISKELSFESDEKNKWFMTKNNDVVELSYIMKKNEAFILCGRSFKHLYNFFEKPFKSCYINIFATVDRKNEIREYGINEIKCKLFLIRHNQELIFFPLLHTLDLLNKN